MFAAAFVTVVWVLPHIASDFGVSICCFVFFWPKFRPESFFHHMGTPGTQMTQGSGRNFGHPLRMVFLQSGSTCRAMLAEISARVSDFPVRQSILVLFWLICACYLLFWNSPLHEMLPCSILFYD